MTKDREINTAIRALGLRGRERQATEWWMTCLRRAGRSIWCHWGRFPGPYDIKELRERLTDDPELLDVFEESYALSCAEFQARLP